MTERDIHSLRTIVPRLIGGGPNEGALVHVEREGPVAIGRRGDDGGWVWIDLVPTGDIEWHGNRPVEVWVPKDLLALWLLEREAFPKESS